ncbi:MAG: tripartite tricarboxylate transporter substrate-binding protein [Geminicoccaceae bacterium]|nr:tripartite tricarboxylate transporter substrate-binding protein [Geminicoccaceae bacterium]
MTAFNPTTRRRFLWTSAIGAGAAGIAASGFRPALAQSFPERTMDVVIPTREGGGADRLYRAFTSVWKEHLGTDFEVGFFPGASGRVGYDVYLKKREANAYNLLFGNMGPELAVLAVQDPDYAWHEDFRYFVRLDSDPSVMFVAADSPFQTVDDVIAAGKERTLSVGTSRLPHPASIGALLVAEETGAQFNLIPLSGGRNTISGVVTGEVDLGVLPLAGVYASGDAVRVLMIWHDERPALDGISEVPLVNEHLGTDFPPLVSSRAFAVHSSVIDEYPDRFQVLQDTARQAAEDPAWPEAAKEAGQPVEILNYGGLEECDEFARRMIELAERYKPLLTGEG